MTQEPNETKQDRIVKVYDRPDSADRRSPAGLIAIIAAIAVVAFLILHFGLHLF